VTVAPRPFDFVYEFIVGWRRLKVPTSGSMIVSRPNLLVSRAQRTLELDDAPASISREQGAPQDRPVYE